MSILLDTNVFLWAAGADDRLSESAKKLLEDKDDEIFFSSVSAWEIAEKWSQGVLKLPLPPDEFIKSVIAASGLLQLPLGLREACAVASLPLHHRDHFDRLLVAQAKTNGLRLMTANPVLEMYDVDVIALWLDDDE